MKSFVKFFAALMLIFGATTFVSCSSDDNGDNGGATPGKTSIPVVQYAVSTTNDLLSVADVVITYWNADGQEVNDTLTSTEWEKSFNLTKSQKVGYSVNVTAKSNLNELLTKETYSLGVINLYLSVKANEEGKVTDLKGSPADGTTLTIAKDRVAEYIATGHMNKSHFATYDKTTNTFSAWGK